MNVRTLFLLSCLLVTALGVRAQHSCCAASSTQAFAALGNDESFRRAHENPLPFVYQNDAGKMITFSTPDGKTGNGYLIPASKPSSKYLFVYHEWWGLNDYIRKEAARFHGDLDNVNVLAIDLYDGKVAATREDASKFMGAVTDQRAEAIIKGAVAYAGRKAKIASVGWCFGGGWSLRSAILEGKKATACVMYYGMPVKDVGQLKKLRTDVLAIFAGREQWINKQVVDDFTKNMHLAGQQLTTKTFDADHAFANPSNPKYDKEAAEAAYEISIRYLGKKLK